MKHIFSILSLCLAATMTTAQNCDFKHLEVMKQLDYELEFIDSLTYVHAKPLSDIYERQDFKRVTEAELSIQYPEVFKKYDDCYRFKTVELEEIEICPTDTTSRDELSHIINTFLGVICNMAVYHTLGWEDYDFRIMVDLTNGLTVKTPVDPISFNCQYAYWFETSYQPKLTVIELETKRQLKLEFHNWQYIDMKQCEDGFFVKLLRISQLKCEEKSKYIRVKLK